MTMRTMREWAGCAARQALAATLALALGLTASPALAAPAESGVEGLAAMRGEFVPGVLVLAFAEPGPGPAAVPVAVSAPTDESGRYRMALKPGSWNLVAVKTPGAPPWPFRNAPGDLYCYYLGNPIVVEAGKMTRVGFNLVAVRKAEPAGAAQGAGVSGRILFEDQPLGRAYVHVYRDTTTNFRGMGMAAQPAGEDGRFRLKLPPGRYYVLARKRQGGGMYGPPEKNDYIGYFPGNPVEVRAGAFTQVELETTTRVDLLEEIWFKEGESAGWFEGVVVDAAAAPVPAVYVLFYTDPALSGSPAFVAGPTDAAGKFKVRAATGTFHLLARSRLGGPVEAGEWYGKALVANDRAAAGPGGPIRITVGRFTPAP